MDISMAGMADGSWVVSLVSYLVLVLLGITGSWDRYAYIPSFIQSPNRQAVLDKEKTPLAPVPLCCKCPAPNR